MLLVAAMIGAACTDDDGPPLLSGMGEAALEVRTDLSCEQLVDATRDQFEVELALAERRLDREGSRVDMARPAPFDQAIESADPSSAEASAAAPDANERADGAPASTVAPGNGDRGAGGAGEVHAGTNNQESAVDEADLVKTDGRRIVSIIDGLLRVVNLDGSPAVDATLDLRAFGTDGTEMFLRGDEALVLVRSWGPSDGGTSPEDSTPGDDDTFVERSPVEPDATSEPERDTSGTTTTIEDGSPTTTPGTAPSTTASTSSTTTPSSSTSTSTTTSSSTTSSTTTTTTIPDVAEPMPMPFEQGIRLLRVDLGASDGAEPTAPGITEQAVVEGQLVAARMIDGTARVVVRSPMPVVAQFDDMRFDGPVMTPQDQLEETRSRLDDLTAEQVMPRMADETGRSTTLGDCADVGVLPLVDTADIGTTASAVPEISAAGGVPSTVTVLTVGADLGELAPATVSGLADIVYASTDALFVTSTDWNDEGPQTLVHRFALEGTEAAQYTGSGAVQGTPLNQYSLSERGGDLRIVTTTDGMQSLDDSATGEPPPDAPLVEPGFPGDPDAPMTLPGIDQPNEGFIAPPVPSTEGRLTVLRPVSSGVLEEVGRVDDLGVGETVQSVRFLGDMAYVVTFRQTDPLYAIDLSDPTEPEALGELKITGFSQYLHPVGDGLLLGIGREATEEGMDTGFKASLFDVSDPRNPSEVDKVVIPNANSMVAQDPLAFTWDPVARQAIIPLERYGVIAGRGPLPDPMPVPIPCVPDEDCTVTTPELVEPAGPGVSVAPVEHASTALVLGVDGTQLTEVAELTHDPDHGDPWQSRILRSLVVDRDLWTLSAAGLGLSDADHPETVQLLPF